MGPAFTIKREYLVDNSGFRVGHQYRNSDRRLAGYPDAGYEGYEITTDTRFRSNYFRGYRCRSRLSLRNTCQHDTLRQRSCHGGWFNHAFFGGTMGDSDRHRGGLDIDVSHLWGVGISLFLAAAFIFLTAGVRYSTSNGVKQ
jgi:hypothetical protein